MRLRFRGAGYFFVSLMAVLLAMPMLPNSALADSEAPQLKAVSRNVGESNVSLEEAHGLSDRATAEVDLALKLLEHFGAAEAFRRTLLEQLVEYFMSSDLLRNTPIEMPQGPHNLAELASDAAIDQAVQRIPLHQLIGQVTDPESYRDSRIEARLLAQGSSDLGAIGRGDRLPGPAVPVPSSLPAADPVTPDVKVDLSGVANPTAVAAPPIPDPVANTSPEQPVTSQDTQSAGDNLVQGLGVKL